MKACRLRLRWKLVAAQNEGLIEVSAYGADSLQSIKLDITSSSDDPLNVAILAGTIFGAQSASVQSMVVRVGKVVLVEPNETVMNIGLYAACANMRLSMPDEDDVLVVGAESAPEDLVKLLDLPDFHNEAFRVQQFAIWTITDNPTRGGYVGLGYFGFGSGPDDEEMGKIRVLFEKAGIETDKYQALS